MKVIVTAYRLCHWVAEEHDLCNNPHQCTRPHEHLHQLWKEFLPGQPGGPYGDPTFYLKQAPALGPDDMLEVTYCLDGDLPSERLRTLISDTRAASLTGAVLPYRPPHREENATSGT